MRWIFRLCLRFCRCTQFNKISCLFAFKLKRFSECKIACDIIIYQLFPRTERHVLDLWELHKDPSTPLPRTRSCSCVAHFRCSNHARQSKRCYDWAGRPTDSFLADNDRIQSRSMQMGRVFSRPTDAHRATPRLLLDTLDNIARLVPTWAAAPCHALRQALVIRPHDNREVLWSANPWGLLSRCWAVHSSLALQTNLLKFIKTDLCVFKIFHI